MAKAIIFDHAGIYLTAPMISKYNHYLDVIKNIFGKSIGIIYPHASPQYMKDNFTNIYEYYNKSFDVVDMVELLTKAREFGDVMAVFIPHEGEIDSDFVKRQTIYLKHLPMDRVVSLLSSNGYPSLSKINIK